MKKQQPPKYTGAWYRHMAGKIEAARTELHYARMRVDREYNRRWMRNMMIILGTPMGFFISRIKKILNNSKIDS